MCGYHRYAVCPPFVRPQCHFLWRNPSLYRLALIEMQTLVSELIENFELSLPKTMCTKSNGSPLASWSPLVRGKWHLGSALPLCVASAKLWIEYALCVATPLSPVMPVQETLTTFTE
ncbi:hypothetical protein C8Q80DRAFT_50021 [Daedaleopsis nitida]|nr:hypothetical protein C8Q80DRAFT_50021 [Daedaleopsis nitida]